MGVYVKARDNSVVYKVKSTGPSTEPCGTPYESQSWGQFLFINSKFHTNSFLSIPESIPIPLVLRKVNSNSIPIPKKSIPYKFHPRMILLIHTEQLYINLKKIKNNNTWYKKKYILFIIL